MPEREAETIDQDIPLVDPPKRYIAMPDSTTFLESACHNPNFRPHSVFVPVSADSDPEASGLYEVDLRTDTVTKRCALPKEGLYFGCKLSDAGVCYLCVGNQGKVLAIDLGDDTKAPEAQTFVDLPGSFQPNDIAIDARHDGGAGRLLIACNDQVYDVLSTRGQTLNALRIAGKKDGAVFSAKLDQPGPATELVSGMRVLAGSVVVPGDGPAGTLWLSELNNLIRVPLDDPKAWERVSPFPPELLADNMETAGTEVLFPYYRVVSSVEEEIMTRSWISRVLYGALRWLPDKLFNKLFGDPPPPGQASDTFEDVCYGRYDFVSKEMISHRIDITNKGFDGHCTAMERVGTDLVFINYLEKEILVVDASKLLG
ncbi:hypothetical protein PPSIR1_40799 [Plesiocystis pacifica SIR-1]|uniref:Uncharacterized protein n=1 Tax=Plesiocystis pacifica SIR-1 TaxID=391625 RepID=A6GHD7_9BACT|nr:hypothetical protein [Plesiocystis pacifica]EDM74701.1 hypothetical protein PPSIR1_40799 [Plesiocystis pacifica SIR-1]